MQALKEAVDTNTYDFKACKIDAKVRKKRQLQIDGSEQRARREKHCQAILKIPPKELIVLLFALFSGLTGSDSCNLCVPGSYSNCSGKPDKILNFKVFSMGLVIMANFHAVLNAQSKLQATGASVCYLCAAGSYSTSLGTRLMLCSLSGCLQCCSHCACCSEKMLRKNAIVLPQETFES